MFREHEAAELTGQVRDIHRPREEEQLESDILGDENVANESEDHPAKGFWVCAYPLASKKAAEVLAAIQTVLGQVNSEFPGDVTRMIRSGTVSKLHGNSAWEIRGRKVREWARTKGSKGPPQQEDIRQTIRVLRDVSEF